MSQTQYWLSRAKMGGRTIPGDTKVMTIPSIVRAAYHRGAQLVKVNDTMVAKLYDPLYYPRFNGCGGMKDSVQNAESDYSCEAVAYQALQNSPAAQAVTPKYFGT
jgi:hypothetical protein